MKIKEIFDFSSEIACTVHLTSLEEILFNELKNINLESDSINLLRLNEFKEQSFDSFLKDKKFIPEKNFIMKYIRKLIKSTYRNNNPSFYIYNKNYIGKEDDDIKTVNNSEIANLIIVPDAFLNEANSDLQTRKMSKYDEIENKESPEDDQQSEDYMLGHDEKEIKSRIGKSFLEKSKIIHDFQKSQDDNNINYTKENASCSSLNQSGLNGKHNTHEDQISFLIPRSGNMKKINSANLINENIEINISEEIHNSNEKIDFKKSHPGYHHKKISSIFQKMRDTSKYSNLCTDFKNYLKNKCFLDVIQSYSNIKMYRNALEKVTIPQFRDINIQSENFDTEIKNNSMVQMKEDEPISVNNKKILCFISILSLLFIAASLFIFLSN